MPFFYITILNGLGDIKGKGKVNSDNDKNRVNNE